MPSTESAVSTDTAKISNRRAGPLNRISRFTPVIFGRAEERNDDMPCDLPFGITDEKRKTHRGARVLVCPAPKVGQDGWCAMGALPLIRTIADADVGGDPRRENNEAISTGRRRISAERIEANNFG